ncbi:MAG TPA: alpha/beta fold hydrolase [Bacteroidota bacterium]|nr:alpha/beta fold hydrolase [Bacteroidota bacterium]
MKIKLNDTTINYTERGLPQGIPVVFIHGFPFNHTMWEPQMKALPNHFRAITYDIRGHGESDVGDGQYTIEFFVDDLLSLLNHLVIDRVILCGLSMGGYIALRAYERFPERIKALVLCDTKGEADTNEAKLKRSDAVRTVKSAGTAKYADEFAAAVFAPQTFQSHPAVVETVKKMIRSNPPIGIAGAALALGCRTDTTGVFAKVNVPTLILVGEQDKLTPPSVAESMQRQIAGSELHIIPYAAHMSNLENAPAFDTYLIEFLNRVKA